VSRNQRPDDDFLQKVRSLANQNNILLIFDECTSGFRETFGGLHLKYNVEPDIAVFGKTLGNGYAITAVLGNEKVMECAQSTFISSTFWSERIGPTAAIQTLEIMKRERSWDLITALGNYTADALRSFNDKFDFNIEVFGLPSMLTYKINHPNWNRHKTFITQEMLKKGFLATNAIYLSTQHKKETIDEFIGELHPVLKQIESEIAGKGTGYTLDGPEASTGFKRLN
jgi:glutamate-1-semialdehyde 2,1-aminomutase